jgi:hypothetical protein
MQAHKITVTMRHELGWLLALAHCLLRLHCWSDSASPICLCLSSQSQSHIATDGQSVSKSWYRAPSGAHDQIFISVWQIRSVSVGRPLWREDGSVFVRAAGPCQRSLSRVLVPWDLRLYFTVSDLRLPFSSPLTTRRVTVEVFDPASTRVASVWNALGPEVGSWRTD